MVTLSKIYTRTGDDGATGLVGGMRRPKYDLRVVCYGTVDEANATIGLARIKAKDLIKLDTVLARVQNDLFDLGSDLANPGSDEGAKHKPLRVVAAQTEWLETTIDYFNKDLKLLKSFVLPGGTELAARLHVARTVVRRAERLAVELRATEPETNKDPVVYLNRLSDLLFVLSRVANAKEDADVLWEPGKHQQG